jgi:uncharacterized membrane protein
LPQNRAPVQRLIRDLGSSSTEGLTPVLERNIRSLQERRAQEEAVATLPARIANAIGCFAGSMAAVFVHLMVYGAWVIANLGWLPGVRPWDPDLYLLGALASIEAIFLSTFVLITQNRMAAAAEKRADLDLQISLLAEHEVTRLVTMVSAIADKVGARTKVEHEIADLEKEVAPEAVLDEMEELDKAEEKPAEPAKRRSV